MIIVNNSAGLIMSYHMLDAVGRGIFTPPDEVAFSWVETVHTQLYPKMLRNFNKLLCYYI